MEIILSQKTAVLLGATGLVGHQLLEQLLAHSAYARVVAPTRRALHRDHPKLENPIVDFNRLERYADLLTGQDIFIALGTTIGKAGSQINFRRVDFDYVVTAASIARQQGANQCLLVSSAGADATSRNFYLRTKGETELAVERLGFWATHIFRPGVLLGEREESRIGERVAAIFSNLLRKLSPKILGGFNPVRADLLAARMVEAAQGVEAGRQVYGAQQLLTPLP